MTSKIDTYDSTGVSYDEVLAGSQAAYLSCVSTQASEMREILDHEGGAFTCRFTAANVGKTFCLVSIQTEWCYFHWSWAS